MVTPTTNGAGQQNDYAKKHASTLSDGHRMLSMNVPITKTERDASEEVYWGWFLMERFQLINAICGEFGAKAVTERETIVATALTWRKRQPNRTFRVAPRPDGLIIDARQEMVLTRAGFIIPRPAGSLPAGSMIYTNAHAPTYQIKGTADAVAAKLPDLIAETCAFVFGPRRKKVEAKAMDMLEARGLGTASKHTTRTGGDVGRA
ncbi:MAG: hypothetical protein GX879_11770 [Bacteroidales bacterium]|nr:hypothetical protein [Bacteroidales bacterium]